MHEFQVELAVLINKHSLENGSDTPDFILAKYLEDCLAAYNHALAVRETWYDRPLRGVLNHPTPLKEGAS